MEPRELFRRFPAADSIPHRRIADLPTAVDPMEDAGAELGIEHLWVKRDDRTGGEYGGNKVRKLEFLLADALDRGEDEVFTVGAIGSHHVLATCIYAREVGLDCAAMHFEQPVTDHVRDNLLALSTTQPTLHFVDHDGAMTPELLRARIGELLKQHPDAYYIPAGGSSPVGALGYVNAAMELAAQIDDGDVPHPDVIYVAAGTCGTLAGLHVGARLAGLDVDIVGVRVVDRALANPTRVAGLCSRIASLLGDHGLEDIPPVPPYEITILDDYFGDDYGVPTDAGLAAIELLEETERLHLEPTYTGKAFSAVVDRADALAERTVLYWHTLSGADLSRRIASANRSALPGEYERFLG